MMRVFGLYARGQSVAAVVTLPCTRSSTGPESAGIAAAHRGGHQTRRELGLVSQVSQRMTCGRSPASGDRTRALLDHGSTRGELSAGAALGGHDGSRPRGRAGPTAT